MISNEIMTTEIFLNIFPAWSIWIEWKGEWIFEFLYSKTSPQFSAALLSAIFGGINLGVRGKVSREFHIYSCVMLDLA